MNVTGDEQAAAIVVVVVVVVVVRSKRRLCFRKVLPSEMVWSRDRLIKRESNCLGLGL